MCAPLPGYGQLVACGIVTNGGVASTVRDAHVRDYHVIVLSDGCAAFSDNAHQAALDDMALVADVVDSASFLQQLGWAAPQPDTLQPRIRNAAELHVEIQVQPAIVGAGACGLTSALALHRLGADCVLLERDAFA